MNSFLRDEESVNDLGLDIKRILPRKNLSHKVHSTLNTIWPFNLNLSS